jgi:hypothetical protein
MDRECPSPAPRTAHAWAVSSNGNRVLVRPGALPVTVYADRFNPSVGFRWRTTQGGRPLNSRPFLTAEAAMADAVQRPRAIGA